MDLDFRNEFLHKWRRFFGNSELPVAFYYTDDPGDIHRANLPSKHRCMVCELTLVRKGTALAWNANTLSCGGARRYLGYEQKMRPDFNHFLSAGIPGTLEGERYIRTPEMVQELMSKMPCIPAGGRFIVFKRFDQLTPVDQPVAVIFFAKPDVLSGLFTLANFDRSGGDGVITPFGSGCASIVHHPYFENEKEHPKAILGMFDVSARPCVPQDVLTFAIPMKKFEKMVGYMDESFLTTTSWNIVQRRL